MTKYKYRARTGEGLAVKGVVEAYDEYEAMDRIRRSCPIVEKLTPVKEKRRINIDLNEPLWVADKTLSLTASRFAIMIRAGIPMSRTVELIAAQTSDKLMKKILTSCAADVAAGCSLARSLEKNGKKIPAVFIESVRAGEESGTLENSFESLKTYYERAHRVKSKVRGAMTYPITVLVIAVVVIAIVIVVFVPTMTSMLAGLGELPLPTRMLIGMSNFISVFWPVLLILAAALGVFFITYGRTVKGGIRLSDLRMRMPVLGRIAKMNTAAQLANTMSTLLGSGIPVNGALGIVGRTLDMRCVGVELAKRVWLLETGQPLASVLADVKYLPEMLVDMTRIGEDSGSLEAMLRTVGDFCSAEAECESDRALSLLEPMITVILGVVVGFIVIAIYMPIFSMSAGAAGGF